MKRKMIVLLAALISLAVPLAAMEHGDHGKKEQMDHGKMAEMQPGEHGGMTMEEGMVMLGEQTEEGARAMAHLKDVKAAMNKMGMKETHHFAVMFVDTASGDPIESGSVAVKIKSPSGKEIGPVKLMGMDGHFGADIVLDEAGKYEFMVGTKLQDGQKRQYHFEHMLM